MLAIQKVKMYWEKDNRTPEGSVMRRDFYKPTRITPEISLDGKGIFICERNYIQDDKVYSESDYGKLYGNRYINASGPSISMEQERRRMHILKMQNQENKWKGYFVSDVTDIEIPGIIVTEEDGKYRVKWYSFEHGYQPVRTGYNEDYHTRGSVCEGQKILCHTAFTLDEGEGGKISFNYRFTGYSGQHYEQYCIYFLNVEELEQNSFVKSEYQYEYSQLADLF